MDVIKLNQTLGKTERLKSRKIIELLFKEGKSVAAHPIRITYKLMVDKGGDQGVDKGVEQPVDQHDVLSNSNPFSTDLKAGFSVSSKNFKKAVHRNRIKRLLRESYRKQKSTLLELTTREGAQISLAIFIIYTGKELPAYEFVDEKMKLALKKLADQLQ